MAHSWADDCPQGGQHDWQFILNAKTGKLEYVCKKCGAK